MLCSLRLVALVQYIVTTPEMDIKVEMMRMMKWKRMENLSEILHLFGYHLYNKKSVRLPLVLVTQI